MGDINDDSLWRIPQNVNTKMNLLKWSNFELIGGSPLLETICYVAILHMETTIHFCLFRVQGD